MTAKRPPGHWFDDVNQPTRLQKAFRTFAMSFLISFGLTTGVGCHGARPTTSDQREVRVAAAADLQFAFDALAAEFRAKNRDVALKVTYGSSGSFHAQLVNRAPFDVYLSADIQYPRKLIEAGLAEKESEFLYAVGHLVIWVPNDSKIDLAKHGMSALSDPAVRKVAIANPAHAPYGRAAEAALKKSGVYEQIKDKLVFGENIAQTAQFVETGTADAGMIALSLALAPALRDKGRHWDVPPELYPRLEQGGVIMTSAQDQRTAQRLRSFILSDQGRAILQRFGFDFPKE